MRTKYPVFRFKNVNDDVVKTKNGTMKKTWKKYVNEDNWIKLQGN